MGWVARDAVAFTVGTVGSVAILVNTLFLQSGPHPAPLFKAPLSPVAAGEATNSVVTAVPRPRPADPAPAKVETPAVPRTPGGILSDIQPELSRRRLFDGSIVRVPGLR